MIGRPVEAGGQIRHPAHDTERAAVRRAARGSQTRRRMVLALLQCHPAGLTDDEGAALMGNGWDRNDFARRRVELVQSGDVIDTGHRRLSARGNPAIVWAALLVHPNSDGAA